MSQWLMGVQATTRGRSSGLRGSYVIATQRVVKDKGKPTEHLAEMPGIPYSELSSHYCWTWYDWLMICDRNVRMMGSKTSLDSSNTLP